MEDLFDITYPNHPDLQQHCSNFSLNSKNKLQELELHNIVNISPIIRNQFIFLVLYLDEKYILHMFQKKFDETKKDWLLSKGRYIATLFLSDTDEIIDIFNWKKTDVELKLENLPHNYINIYQDLFIYKINTDELEIMLNNEHNLNSVTTHQYLSRIDSGIYCNILDIRWQIVVKSIMSSHLGHGGILCQYYRTLDFNHLTLVESYFPNYDESSVYEYKYIRDTNIVCDMCHKSICYDLETRFWHNGNCGDLCEMCYKNKKQEELKRKLYAKSQLLLEGKRVCFRKKLAITYQRLKNINLDKIVLTNETRLRIYKDVNQELMRNFFLSDKRKQCGICFDLLYEELSAGTCGHCFHTKCIEYIPSNSCPFCRTKTKFFKLFLYKN